MIATSFCGSRSRSSTRVAQAGITFGEFGVTSMWPTVPTWRPGRA
jgi:hypothetical protein